MSGSWYGTGCALTGPPSQVGSPYSAPARCLGEVTDSWTGYYVDDEQTTVDAPWTGGFGEYHGTWLRPRRAPTGRSTPCPPPPPKAISVA